MISFFNNVVKNQYGRKSRAYSAVVNPKQTTKSSPKKRVKVPQEIVFASKRDLSTNYKDRLTFSDASTYLYMRVFPSIGPSVRRSVYWSIRWSVCWSACRSIRWSWMGFFFQNFSKLLKTPQNSSEHLQTPHNSSKTSNLNYFCKMSSKLSQTKCWTHHCTLGYLFYIPWSLS